MPYHLCTPRVTVIAVGLVLIGIFGCAKKEQAGTDTLAASSTAATDISANKSLYDRLGGKAAITAVIDTFVAKAAADPRINKKFAKTNVPRLKTELVDQVCAETGGPCAYTGRSMKEAHRNLHITQRDWDAMVHDFVEVLDQFKVPKAEQTELLTIVGSTKGDIVVQQSATAATP